MISTNTPLVDNTNTEEDVSEAIEQGVHLIWSILGGSGIFGSIFVYLLCKYCANKSGGKDLDHTPNTVASQDIESAVAKLSRILSVVPNESLHQEVETGGEVLPS